jgi:hypothetical protein
VTRSVPLCLITLLFFFLDISLHNVWASCNLSITPCYCLSSLHEKQHLVVVSCVLSMPSSSTFILDLLSSGIFSSNYHNPSLACWFIRCTVKSNLHSLGTCVVSSHRKQVTQVMGHSLVGWLVLQWWHCSWHSSDRCPITPQILQARNVILASSLGSLLPRPFWGRLLLVLAKIWGIICTIREWSSSTCYIPGGNSLLSGLIKFWVKTRINSACTSTICCIATTNWGFLRLF